MSSFLNLSKQDKEKLITNTSRKLHMSKAIIEKDFWVCWILQYLFSKFKYKDFICFKGGTSLSKVYHCIERFSEDVDLAINWEALGIVKEDAYAERSKRQQEIFNKTANQKTKEYLRDVWIPLMEMDLQKELHKDFKLYIDESDEQTICFQYPKDYEESAILSIIRLEIGALAEPIPSSWKTIKSYVAEVYPALFGEEEIHVNVVDIDRTFFEKITILHREANRVNGNYPMRYSRHYYDVYQMIEKGIGKTIVEESELLENVVHFKKKFYTCNWAKYDEVLTGNCKLIPNESAIQFFSKDYDAMKGMIYGDHPTFQRILFVLCEYEKELNDHLLHR